MRFSQLSSNYYQVSETKTFVIGISQEKNAILIFSLRLTCVSKVIIDKLSKLLNIVGETMNENKKCFYVFQSDSPIISHLVSA